MFDPLYFMTPAKRVAALGRAGATGPFTVFVAEGSGHLPNAEEIRDLYRLLRQYRADRITTPTGGRFIAEVFAKGGPVSGGAAVRTAGNVDEYVRVGKDGVAFRDQYLKGPRLDVQKFALDLVKAMRKASRF